jgi:polar amino acid transport system substrate-binding protein
VLSAPIGNSPLGFAERVDTPVQWQRLADLAQYRIGVVRGYVNTEELDRRIAEQLQPVDTARDDAQNLLKLVARRVPLAVIDRRVFEYIIRHDPKLMPFAAQLRFNDRLLENKKLYVAFRPDAQGERARKILNEGLKKIDAKAVMEAAIR